MEGNLGPGTVLLGKYRVESVLGRGGMGVVLRVTHLQLGEELAIKVLLPEVATSPEVIARFLREAQAVVRLRGEHVAKVIDLGVLPEGLPFMVMEYLRGLDLAGELGRRKQLFPGEAVDYVLQACEALAEAHVHGIVHRDIKPANLFLTTRPDGTPLVKVLDFGISKAPLIASGLVTRTDTVMGTAGYMSPEQMKATRDVDARTDIWALGIVLYECVNGWRPFEGESFSAVVLKAGTEPPPPMDPRVPRGLQAIVLRCLEKDRRARYSSIAELAAALAPFARDQRAAATVVHRTNLIQQRPGSAAEPPPPRDHVPVSTTLSSSAGPVPARSRRRRYLFAGVVSFLGAAALIVVAGLLISGRFDRPKDGIVEPGNQNAGPGPDAAGDETVAVVRPSTDVTPDAPATTPVATPDDGKAQKLAQCADLNVQRKWQDLLDCAAGLEQLGDHARAKELRTKATQETANEATDGKIRQALRVGSLKEAQGLLKGMSPDSVYHKSLSDLFDKADETNTDDARRRSQALIAAHDCTRLKRYLAQQQTGASGTERVIALVGAALARCGEKPPAEPRQPPAGRGSGSANLASSGSEQPAVTPAATPKQQHCETMNVEDALSQAANQYANGFASAALYLTLDALKCRQDVRLWRLAAMYACAAHELPTAKTYFAKLPSNPPTMQSGIEQKCQQEGLNIRGP